MSQKVYTETFTRDDEAESDVLVHYTYLPGSPPHYGSMSYAGHPGEPPEIEIVKATVLDWEVTLTSEEEGRFIDWLSGNHHEDW